jgi:hypothetical protein
MESAVQYSANRFAAVAAFALLASCSGRSPLDGPPDARLTYNEASAIAMDAAKANGVKTAEYNQPVLNFDKQRHGAEWRVSFTMLPPERPGGHFAILINDDTKHVQFEPGE